MRNFLTLIMLLVTVSLTAQVGIGTTNPQEQLHIFGNASTVRVDGLSSTGTVTGTAVKSVSVDANGNLIAGGIYAYRNEFSQSSQVTIPIQDSSASVTSYNIPGIDGQSITVSEDGYYQFDFSGYYGAGSVDIPTAEGTYICNGEGYFTLTVNGTSADAFVHSTSIGTKTGNGAASSTNSSSYYNLASNTQINKQIYLTAGTYTITCTFNLYYMDGDCDANDGIVGGGYGGSDDCKLSIHYVGQ